MEVTIDVQEVDQTKMNFSWGSADSFDDEGNKVSVYVWVNGDWKVTYKDKHYLVSLNSVVNSILDKINEQEK